MTSTATSARASSARNGVTLPVALAALGSLVLCALARGEPIAAPATTWPVVIAMVGAAGVQVAVIRTLGPGWPDLGRLLSVLAVAAAAYPGLWALATIVSAQLPHSTPSWATAVLAGTGHLPVLGAFSVVPLLTVRYLGSGTGRSLITAVLVLATAAAISFALFFDDFEPLAASALVASTVGAQMGMVLNLAYLATVLLGPVIALLCTWRNATDLPAARRLAMVAGSSLVGTLLVMVCGVLGEASALGAAALLVGMYAALTVVVAGCVKALSVDLAEPSTGPLCVVPTVAARPGPVDAAEPAAPAGRAAAPPHTPAGGLPTLTPREREVLGLLADGLSNAGIAARLVLSERTVDAHLRSVFVKLDLPAGPEHNRRVQAVNAFRSGSAEPPADSRRTPASP